MIYPYVMSHCQLVKTNINRYTDAERVRVKFKNKLNADQYALSLKIIFSFYFLPVAVQRMKMFSFTYSRIFLRESGLNDGKV